MLLDSGHIQESDILYLNKKRMRRGEPPMKPLYTFEDAREALQDLTPVKYIQKFMPVPSMEVEFYDAGHILSSAAIKMDIRENETQKRLWFSGDNGRNRLPLLRDSVLPDSIDHFIMECTYGDKPHRDPFQTFEEFQMVVKRTIHRGGKLSSQHLLSEEPRSWFTF